jgi:hypothetical protein
MRVRSIAFAMIAALFQVGPCQADFWPDHAPIAFAQYTEAAINTSHDPAVTGRTAPMVSLDVRTDALGHVFFAEVHVPEAGEITLAELPQPTDASEVISRDILVQVLTAAARARLKTDDVVLNQMLAAYLDDADLTTGSLPRYEELKPYVSHEAEDTAVELTTRSVTPRPVNGGQAVRSSAALPFELPSGI